MYNEHKLKLIIDFAIIFFISFISNMNFSDLSSECIAIVSINLAIYTVCIGCLINSTLLIKMKNSKDKKIGGKTELGVLKTYMELAMKNSIITIVLACVYKIRIFEIPKCIPMSDFITLIIKNQQFVRIFSSICFSFFSINFIFIWLIFIFIINKQMDVYE